MAFTYLPQESALFNTSSPSKYSFLNNQSSKGLASSFGLNDAIDTSYLDTPVDSMIDLGVDEGGIFSGLGDMLSNNSLMSGITGLGSTLAQIASLPSQIKWAKANTDALKQNMETARLEQARRNKNISGFNSIDTSRYA